MAADREPSRFAAWRGRRPFWGGVLATVGGCEILLTQHMPMSIALHIGMLGLAGFLLPALLIVCGQLILFNPAQRLFYSVVGCLLALGTWITSNLGGFVIGLLLGLAGCSMAFGWLPEQEPRRRILRRRSRASAAS